MLRVRGFAVVTLGIVLCAAGSAGADDGGPIAADRPGAGNAPTTLLTGHLQIESGLSYTKDADTHTFFVPTMLRYGIVGWLEARLGNGIVGIAGGGGETQTYGTDLVAGLKGQILRAGGEAPDLAVTLDVAFPTGKGPFTGDVVVPDLSLAAGWVLEAGFGVQLDVGADVPEDEMGRFARLGFVFDVLYTAVDGRLDLFIEASGRVALASGRKDTFQVGAGAAFRLSNQVQLDLWGQYGLTEAAPDFHLEAGVSVRL